MGTPDAKVTIYTFEEHARQSPGGQQPWMDITAEPPVGLADQVAQMGYQVKSDIEGRSGEERFRVLPTPGTNRQELAERIAGVYTGLLREARQQADIQPRVTIGESDLELLRLATEALTAGAAQRLRAANERVQRAQATAYLFGALAGLTRAMGRLGRIR